VEYLSDHYPLIYPAYRQLDRSLLYALFHLVGPIPYRLSFGSEKITVEPFGQRRLLDVGCGSGEYLDDMQKIGWDVHGVDFNGAGVQVARTRVGASRVSLGTLESIDPSLGEFDLITMNHYLEHVADPRCVLEEAYRRLANGGKLKIIVPDVSGFEAGLFGRYWIGLDVPRHLVNFSKRTLAAFLDQANFRVLSCRPQFFPVLAYGSADIVLDRRFGLRSRLLRYGLTTPIVALALLSYSFGNRGAIEVVAQKR
jgi:SAM-dependent methyltransferase